MAPGGDVVGEWAAHGERMRVHLMRQRNGDFFRLRVQTQPPPGCETPVPPTACSPGCSRLVERRKRKEHKQQQKNNASRSL